MAKHMAVRREENGIEGTNFIVTERCLDLVKKACCQSMLLKWWRQICSQMSLEKFQRSQRKNNSWSHAYIFPKLYSQKLVDHFVTSLTTTIVIHSMKKIITPDLNPCCETKNNYCLCILPRSEEMLWSKCHLMPPVSISGINFINYSLLVLLWICWQTLNESQSANQLRYIKFEIHDVHLNATIFHGSLRSTNNLRIAWWCKSTVLMKAVITFL